jgi:hypothetical protein
MPPAGWTQLITNTAYTWRIGVSGSTHGGWHFAEVPYDPDHTPAYNEILFSPYFITSGGSVSLYSAGSVVNCTGANDSRCDLEIWLVNGGWDAGSGNDILLGKAEEDWSADFTWSHSVFSYTPYVLPATTVRIAIRYTGPVGSQVKLDDIILDY